MPTYTVTPPECAYRVSYQLSQTSDGTCASWFSCSPNVSNEIEIGTIDEVLIGVQCLKISAFFESASLLDDSVTFNVDIFILAESLLELTKVED